MGKLNPKEAVLFGDKQKETYNLSWSKSLQCPPPAVYTKKIDKRWTTFPDPTQK